MILHFSYEELTALRAGAEVYLEGETASGGSVMAPPRVRGHVQALLPHLHGDMSLSTLGELRGVQSAVRAVVEMLRAEMESVVVVTHAADEGAVAAYFDFAHAFTVAHRIDEMVSEMTAMIELVTGEAPTHLTERTFQFPD